jgi:16S rRNA (guanine966-N2)-methyltransferase
VISGSARGRQIVAPSGHSVRPTSDKTRQAVFNALVSRNFVQDATVVDLYAGSGALGIEALSRGAARVTFVEQDRTAAECIRHNLEHLQMTAGCQVVRSEVLRWLDGAGSRPFEVDSGAPLLVLADPPYSFTGWHGMLTRLHHRLAPLGVDALAVLESRGTIELPPDWELEREHRYGAATVTFARPVGEGSTDEGSVAERSVDERSVDDLQSEDEPSKP